MVKYRTEELIPSRKSRSNTRYIEDKTGVSTIDSIPDCHTENALKRGKNQEMLLRCYIEDGFVTK